MKTGKQQTSLDKLLRQQQRIAKQIEQHRRAQLRRLPGQFGFESIDDLIDALQSLSPRQRSDAKSAGNSPPQIQRGSGRGRGSRHSDDVKAAVKADLEKGEDTVAAIAKRRNVALATVNFWKKTWGLTKDRRKKRK